MNNTSRVKGTVYIGPHGSFREEDAGIVPVPADMPGVKGVFLGGCVSTGIGRISVKGRERAHAHTGGRHKAWVCFSNPSFLQEKALRMHELAHIQTGQGHTDKWREAMRKLDQEIPPRYQPKASKKKSL